MFTVCVFYFNYKLVQRIHYVRKQSTSGGHRTAPSLLVQNWFVSFILFVYVASRSSSTCVGKDMSTLQIGETETWGA